MKFPSEPPPTDASSSFQPSCFAISEAFLYSAATPAPRSMGGRFTPPVISSLHLRLKSLSAFNRRSIPGTSFRRATRTSRLAVAVAGITFVRVPPEIWPTFRVRPRFRSTSLAMAVICLAISTIALSTFLEIQS